MTHKKTKREATTEWNDHLILGMSAKLIWLRKDQINIERYCEIHLTYNSVSKGGLHNHCGYQIQKKRTTKW